jgi:Ca2+-binding RTX toxin-like protein
MSQSTITFYQGTAGRREQFLYNNTQALVDAGDQGDYVNSHFGMTIAIYDQTIYGGLGFDIISTGLGADTIFGDRPGDGDGGTSVNPDWITSGGGADIVFGQSGNDYINGELNSDYVSGGGGNDFVQGGGGDDWVLGGDGDDILVSGAIDPAPFGYNEAILVQYDGITDTPIADTVINGQPGSLATTITGNDFLSGGDGDDTLFGQDGTDTLRGDSGDDTIEGGSGGDDIDGGSGIDTASYASSGDGVVVFLTPGAGIDGDASGDTLIGIENLLGSGFSDNFFGDAGSNTLDGAAGNDFLTGGRGQDILFGGADADRFIFNSRAETPKGAANRDVIMDFSHAQDDVIDLSVIDANTHKGGNQAFHFIRGQKFHHEEGELRFKNDILSGDVNGDGRADFQIEVANANLVKGDFVL